MFKGYIILDFTSINALIAYIVYYFYLSVFSLNKYLILINFAYMYYHKSSCLCFTDTNIVSDYMSYEKHTKKTCKEKDEYFKT